MYKTAINVLHLNHEWSIIAIKNFPGLLQKVLSKGVRRRDRFLR
jgi:hypothetical protein